MRAGKNTSKNKKLEAGTSDHRVIIPLYIPEEKGYYQESYQVFEMCLNSLLRTSLTRLKISVVSNASCRTVNEKLFALYKENKIDELILESEKIGKINSILKVLRTAEERLITITDADVLFKNQWEERVIEIFTSFPKAGMVSPVPVFRTQLRYTYNIWARYFFSEKLQFRKVKNPADMTRFAESLGWSYLSDKLKDVILTLKNTDGTLAVVGNSHFVGTYKREVFELLPKTNSSYQLGGDSERFYTDMPVIASGGYRLATYDNYAYHIGNKVEPWMTAVEEELVLQEKWDVDLTSIPQISSNAWSYFLTFKVFPKIFTFKPVKRLIYRYKGLSREQCDNFLNGDYE